MKGDFSRITFNDQKNYSLVMMQQGRVQLDADWNEQAIIHWANLQRLAEDLIGEHGGPSNNLGFGITSRIEDDEEVPLDFLITKGRYYVNGLVCENNDNCAFTQQKNYPFPEPQGLASGKKYLVYLHVWWRHITAIEDNYIREAALGGPDTATRMQTVWQVKVLEEMEGDLSDITSNNESSFAAFEDLLKQRKIKRSTGRLKAKAKQASTNNEPCITAPENRYRGPENQLYRVEIHRGGTAAEGATFKWSRDNGSVVFPILSMSGEKVTLEHLGKDSRFGLQPGDWVEMVDDTYQLLQKSENLSQVIEVDPDTRQVTLSNAPALGVDFLSRHPLLRRWDHGANEVIGGALPVKEDVWISLEDGIEIFFQKQEQNQADEVDEFYYQSGDWWWIPARTATGDIEWPLEENGETPAARRPYDPGHRYAPLAIIQFDSDGKLSEGVLDLRRKFNALWKWGGLNMM